MSDDASGPPPQFIVVGDSLARPFGMAAADWANAIAADAGMEPASAALDGRGAVLGNIDFAFDPAWARAIAAQPGSALVSDGRAVLVHVPADRDLAGAALAMGEGRGVNSEDYRLLDAGRSPSPSSEPRKRRRRFVLPLVAGEEETVERAAFDAASTETGDALSLFVWRGPAFLVTRAAARAGLSPTLVTLAGFLLCVIAFVLFWFGRYWEGCAAAFGFTLLATVDCKLAGCCGRSSGWGRQLTQGIDLLQPPFWWWAWAEGLGKHGPLLRRGFPGFEPVYGMLLVSAIIGGDFATRVIREIFRRRFAMPMPAWRPVDRRFQLFSAGRNPNLIILFASLIAGRPDVGLQLVALWTIVSLIFHAVRLAMANGRADRGRQIISWQS